MAKRLRAKKTFLRSQAKPSAATSSTGKSPSAKLSAKSNGKSGEATPTPKKRRSWGKLYLAVWMGIAVLAIFQALVSNSQATNGRQLEALQQRQDNLSTQNNLLQQQVAASGSLQTIKQYAQDQLQLQPLAKNVLYLPLSTPEAKP